MELGIGIMCLLVVCFIFNSHKIYNQRKKETSVGAT